MTATAQLLMSLEAIVAETTRMLGVLDQNAQSTVSESDRRETKRRTIEIRSSAQELFNWLGEVRLEELRH